MRDTISNHLEDSELESYTPPSRGNTLAHFTNPNNKYSGLSSAEEQLLEACVRGEDCIIGNGERPTLASEQNEIRGSFLRYLILGGCQKIKPHARGVRLIGAFITRRKTPDQNICLDLNAAKISKDVYVANCNLEGDVILYGANCKTFSLQGSLVDSILADRISSEGSIMLRNGFQTEGGVQLKGAKIGGDLDCKKAKFKNSNIALYCDRIEVKGDIFLDQGFTASGEVRLLGAKIGGDLTCNNGIFKNHLNAKGASIGGNVWLDKAFQISDFVSLSNAIIGGNLNCSGGTFHSKQGAIHANKSTIAGNVILGECNSAGTFAFQGAKIDGDFSAQGATLSAKNSIELRNAQIAGTFVWREIKHSPGMLDLGGAKVKSLNMDEKSWQKPSAIKLNNFIYDGFENLEPGANTSYWKRFLEKQPKSDLTDRFRPKPFEHLAKVLDTIGFEEEARGMRIQRQRLQTEFLQKHDPDRVKLDGHGNKHTNWQHKLNVFWRKNISGFFVDYGYRPGKAAIYLAILIMAGTLIYWNAAKSGIMTPTHPLIFKEATNGGFIPERCADNWVYFPADIADKCADAVPSEYSEFNSFIYAADVVLPIVNFRMEADWSPRVVDVKGQRNWHGWLVRLGEWILIFLGWVLSLLFVSAVGGIIRR